MESNVYTAICTWSWWPFINFVLNIFTVAVVAYLIFRVATVVRKVDNKVDGISLAITRAHQEALSLFVDRLLPPKQTKE